MKKLVSTVAALAVVAAMGATAMAAGLPSPTTGDFAVTPVSVDSDYYDITATALDDDYLDFVVSFFGEDLMDLAAEAAGDTEVAAIELTELTITNKTSGEDVTDYDYFDVDNPLTVAFAFDDASTVIAVLIWDASVGEFVAADFTVDGNDVIVTLNDVLAPVTFVTKAVKADEPSKDDGKGSAQTGYDALVYVVSAVALAAGAVFFFATSSKKTAKEVM